MDPRIGRRRFFGYAGSAGASSLLFPSFLPFGSRETMEFEDPQGKSRPSAEADEYMAATGTPWATDAALDILEDGGNAVDAAVGALLMINVTFGEAASFPGVAPVVVYDAKAEEYKSYTGAGTAPENATIDHFRSQGHETMPSLSIESQLLPASPDVAVELLKEGGTMSFGEVVEPSVETAREGFPVHRLMLHNLDQSLIERFGFYILMPYNVKVYLDGQWWRPLHHSERFTRPDLAETFEQLAEAEKDVLNDGGSREEGLEAVRREFYEGEIADRIVEFHDERGGLFTRDDLSGYEGYWEEPVTGSYAEYEVHTNSFWSQGPVVPMILRILEGVDIPRSPEDAEYAHKVIQAIDLAMADRDTYMGDPEYVDVPAEGLLSEEYASERRSRMTPDSNFSDTPEPGNPRGFGEEGGAGTETAADGETGGNGKAREDGRYYPDTSYLAVVDGEGNAVSMTPSDFPMTPMVPGTGLTLGNRMTQFRLDPDHPSSLEPGKRPRITPHAVMVSKDGDFHMSFGTPGGDTQTQALVQVFLNTVVFGMGIQEAIEAPRFVSANFPNSFAPHEYSPGTVEIERSLYDEVGDGLEEKGYELDVYDDWADGDRFGGVCAVKRAEDGGLVGGADPRLESWAAGDSSRYF
jgi:gamma-glutamyltranspeptidase/glutathione hydrolase